MTTEAALPAPTLTAAARPRVSVVVPLLNEERTVERLHRRISEAFAAGGLDGEMIFIDDGSTDRTLELLTALHAADPRVRVVSFKRNFGQHPAMHAGMVRARGEVIVTMDGDLQNDPADIPRLVAALDGADVASGTRVRRKDALVVRRLPSLIINRLLQRLTGTRISDFGCAFNAYRRDALEPVLHRVGRQKFTKALVCTTGARVTEVDLAHTAREDRSRYSALKLLTLSMHVLTGFWAQLVQWVGAALAVLGILTSAVIGVWGLVYWIGEGDFPGPLLLGGLVMFVLGLQGFLMAVLGEYLQKIQRDVELRPLYYIERELG